MINSILVKKREKAFITKIIRISSSPTQHFAAKNWLVSSKRKGNEKEEVKVEKKDYSRKIVDLELKILRSKEEEKNTETNLEQLQRVDLLAAC